MIKIDVETKTIIVVGNHHNQSIYKFCKTWLYNNSLYGDFLNGTQDVHNLVLSKPWTIHRKNN